MGIFRNYLKESRGNGIHIPTTFNDAQKNALKNIKNSVEQEVSDADGDVEAAVTHLLNSIDYEVVKELTSDEYDQVWEYVTFLANDLDYDYSK